MCYRKPLLLLVPSWECYMLYLLVPRRSRSAWGCSPFAAGPAPWSDSQRSPGCVLRGPEILWKKSKQTNKWSFTSKTIPVATFIFTWWCLSFVNQRGPLYHQFICGCPGGWSGQCLRKRVCHSGSSLTQGLTRESQSYLASLNAELLATRQSGECHEKLIHTPAMLHTCFWHEAPLELTHHVSLSQLTHTNSIKHLREHFVNFLVDFPHRQSLQFLTRQPEPKREKKKS
jgi:hypothetical protein